MPMRLLLCSLRAASGPTCRDACVHLSRRLMKRPLSSLLHIRFSLLVACQNTCSKDILDGAHPKHFWPSHVFYRTWLLLTKRTCISVCLMSEPSSPPLPWLLSPLRPAASFDGDGPCNALPTWCMICGPGNLMHPAYMVRRACLCLYPYSFKYCP